MVSNISKRNSAYALTANASRKSLLGDKSLGIEPANHFYGIKYGDKTE